METELARAADELTVRVATNADGPTIGALFARAALADLGVDWTTARPAGWWIVAEREGKIVGAIQVAAASPFGFVGDVVVEPREQGRRDGNTSLARGHVAILLYAWAFEAIRRNGGQVALGVTNLPAMRRLLRRYGGQELGEMTLFAKALLHARMTDDHGDG